MKSNIEKIFKIIALILLWTVFSPLFLFFALRWKIVRKGWNTAIFVISPFMTVVYLLLTILVMWGYSEYDRKYGYSSNKAIERITGVDFPKLYIVEYNKGMKSFNGDYTDSFELEMETELKESSYRVLDSLVSGNSTHWSFYDGEYTFNTMWGNGLLAPEGESSDEDRFFSISVKKGNRIVNLKTGMW